MPLAELHEAGHSLSREVPTTNLLSDLISIGSIELSEGLGLDWRRVHKGAVKVKDDDPDIQRVGHRTDACQALPGSADDA